MIRGVSPLMGFPVERREIGHLVPILGGQRLAGLVRLGGGVSPSAGCQVGTVFQLVGPAPALHGALGGRRASAGYGTTSRLTKNLRLNYNWCKHPRLAAVRQGRADTRCVEAELQ